MYLIIFFLIHWKNMDTLIIVSWYFCCFDYKLEWTLELIWPCYSSCLSIFHSCRGLTITREGLQFDTSSGLTLTQGHWEQSVLGCANAYHDTGNLVLRYHLKFPDFYTYCLLIYVWLYLFSNWEISEISCVSSTRKVYNL